MKEKENPFEPYELQFSVQQRKVMVAEMIKELRKAKGYQQKQVAELLDISPQTYNGYETGRNEPPVEILVRISYLFDMPIDVLVQRDKLHADGESIQVTINKYLDELYKVKKDFKNSQYAENKQLNDLMTLMEQTMSAVKGYANVVEQTRQPKQDDE